jgi:hypothetical protein
MTTKTRGRRRLALRPPHRRIPIPKRLPEHPFTRVWREVAHGEWRWVHIEDPRAPE